MKNKILSVFIAMAMVITQLSILNVSANDDTTSDWLHSVTLRPIDATYTSQHGEDANTNFHDSPNMMVNYTNRIGGTDAWGQYGYMKFDIGNIDRESVISAKLRLYVENAGDKTSSTRTIGIYETWESDWDGSSMTWATGRSEARKQLDSFTVTASGGNIIDAGWRELDVTDCVRNGIDPYVSLMAKMTSEVGYRVAITSGTYTGLPEDFDENIHGKNMPELVIESHDAELASSSRTNISASQDTYVEQNGSSSTTNFSDNEYLKINYTNNENRSDYYGSYSYLDFNVNETNRNNVASAKLWVYIDKDSDIRKSTRTIGVFKPSSAWDSSMTWSSGRVAADGDAIASFTVSGNGYYVTDPGWRCIDVTDYVKNLSSDNASFMMKTIEGSAHPVLIHSMEHSNEATRPRLVITTNDCSSDEVITDNGKLTAVYNDNVVTIRGKSKVAELQLVIIRIFNPECDSDKSRGLIVVDQVESDDDGSFVYSYNLPNANEGTYQVLASFEYDLEGQKTTFNVGNPMAIKDISAENSQMSEVPYVEINPSTRYYTDNTLINVETAINNMGIDEEQHITTIAAFYKVSGELIEYVESGTVVQPGMTEKHTMKLRAPENAEGTLLKVFAAEGSTVYNGSIVPLTYTEYISYNKYADVSNDEDDESEVLPRGRWIQLDTSHSDNVSLNDDFEIEETYSYNGVFCEKAIHDNTEFTVELSIKNNSTKTAKFAWVETNPNDPNVGIFMGEEIVVGGHEEKTVTISFDSKYLQYMEDEEHQPEPTSNWVPVTLGYDIPFEKGQQNDFFNDTFDTATLLTKYSNPVEGKINFENDVDFVKFTPTETGSHVFHISTDDSNERDTTPLGLEVDMDTSFVLYDSDQTAIKVGNSSFGVELEAGQTYYLKISGSSINNYQFQIQKVSYYEPLTSRPCTAGGYQNVSVVAESGLDLSNTEFCVLFFPGDFELYDACTKANGRILNTGEISEQNLIITGISNNCVSFKSTSPSGAARIINTIKLKSLKDGMSNIIIYRK